jgi:hypothetical protein
MQPNSTRYVIGFLVLAWLLFKPIHAQTPVVCTGGPCALEITQQAVNGSLQQIFAQGAKDATLVNAVTQLQSLVTQLSTTSAGPLTVTETYTNTTDFSGVLANCTPPTLLNGPALAAIVNACTKYNLSAQKLVTLQTQFNADMTALKSQFTTLSTAPPTTAGVLSNSLQVQALLGVQSNLIGRHRANMEILKIEINNVNLALKAVRNSPFFGK